MKILRGGEWCDGFLDPWLAPGELRIEVRRWVVVQELDDLFIPQPYDPRRVIDYAREVGPIEVARKVMSRLSENHRNDKVAACGLGIDLATGAHVAFFAPCVPRGVERVVLPPSLVWEASGVPDQLEHATRLVDDFVRWSAWTRECGRVLRDLDQLQHLVARHVADPCTPANLGPGTVVQERTGEPVEGQRLKASVFGYGHYVRTVVLSSLPPEIEVVTVHELDPVLAPDGFPSVDTCPDLRDDEYPDVVFVAGFHHTHAPISAEALRRGAVVVAEKPLATSADQMEILRAEWRTPSRYFGSFQRRFMAANRLALEDLDVSPSNPMSYHALVHEVSLPAGHWYQWPSSGSRMLSNGCHWVDHFLWLNDFSTVVDRHARRGPNGEIVCDLTLENGAYFTLTLTHRGSDRLGVREHTELRVADRTVVIEDMQTYRSEGPRGIIRREKFPRLAAHRAMYKDFARRIVAGEPGDPWQWVESSAQTVLDLEAMLTA